MKGEERIGRLELGGRGTKEHGTGESERGEGGTVKGVCWDDILSDVTELKEETGRQLQKPV